MTTGLRARLSARVGALEIEIELDTGEGPLVLVGPNGAGKTSVLSMLLGAITPTRGRIEVAEALLFDSTRHVNVPVEQRRLGYVPQDYGLFPHMTVAQNLGFVVGSSRSAEDRKQRAELGASLLQEFGLSAVVARRATQLSGGEKQRLALARALAMNPRALLLDEPLAALDAEARSEVRTFLARYLSRLRLPTIVVTHDADDAIALAHRVAVLEQGRLVQLGTWSELSARPASRFAEELVATRTRRLERDAPQ